MATKKALVIDDEEAILHICSELLGKEGFSVVTVKSGMSAFEHFYQQSFDLVITSLAMKSGTGFTVLGMIKALSPRIPVIVFTEKGCSIAYQFLPLLGTCAFISKPCSGEILASCINSPPINGINHSAPTLEVL